jgi:hypothetical protein
MVTTAAGARLVRGDKELTPNFAAIDSYDISQERGEVVFSAKRKDNFDIGLVSTDGSDIHWIFDEPADETLAQWAPRGTKISYVVHTSIGDVIRTVHIPTAATLNVPFPWSRIHALAYEPAGERISVTLAGVTASEHVESVKYGGEGQRTDVAPSASLDLLPEPFAGGVLLRPPVMRYGDRYPLVVWIGDPAEWSDARGELLRQGGIACAVVRKPPDSAFWTAVAESPSLDAGRVWVVGAAGDREGVTYVAPATDLPAGRYRMRDRVLYAPAAVVQSMAARFIADQLKRTGPRNGIHR